MDNNGKTRRRWVKLTLITTVVVLFLGLLVWLWYIVVNKTQDSNLSKDDTIEIILGALESGDVTLLSIGNLTVNGLLTADGGFILSPSGQPSNATTGQIYYDKIRNQLMVFDGVKFASLASNKDVEKTIADKIRENNEEQGSTPPPITTQQSFTVGNGLALTDGVLSNSGVTALQGQTGAVTLTADSGIAVDGTTISNTGIKSIIAGANITINDDGNGNVTINSSGGGGGGGTVSSPGGTPGRIAKFTGVQEIADSIMTESGTAITVGGDLTVTGSTTFANALTVGNGGTGATSLANNGVIIGQGANALTAVTAAGPGLCFLSTAAAPEFAACPSGGVTSLNGTTGDLTIANTSTAGTTITIDDASTTQKGIAQFDGDNFTASGGVVNTIQDIATSATPMFSGVNTNNITPSGALTVGATDQSFTLQGSSASTITATSGANTTTLNFATPTANNTITLADESGTVCLQGSSNCNFASASGSDGYIQNTTTIQTNANMAIQGVGGLSATAVIRDASVQSADLLQFQTSAGGVVAGIRPSGTIYSAPITDPSVDVPANARLFVQPFSSGSTAIIARAAASTPATGDVIKVQNSAGTSDLFTVGATGEVTNTVNSDGAFRVLNAASVPLFQVSTTNNRVHIGNLTADGTGALLVLDTKNTVGDPTGVNGGMYYDSNTGKFRCFEASAWKNCIDDERIGQTVAQLRRNLAQSIPDNTSTNILWDTQDYLPFGGHSTSTNPERFTPTKAGRYTIYAKAGFATNSTGRRAIQIAKNDVNLNGSFRSIMASPSGTGGVDVQLTVDLNGTTDYITVRALHTAGSALDLTSDGPAGSTLIVTYSGP
jgi:hypothetical protein